MVFLLHEYLGIFILFVLSTAISGIILALSYWFAPFEYTSEKAVAYECGFDAFEDARSTFDVRFFRVAILFLIFDLELSFLFPWALVLSQLNYFGFMSMMLFLFILTLGFIYEYKKGALDW